MIKLLGLLLILIGIALGAYVALYLCLIGGIIQIIEAAKHTPIESAGIAWGIMRVIITGPSFWLTAVLPVSFGIAFLND